MKGTCLLLPRIFFSKSDSSKRKFYLSIIRRQLTARSDLKTLNFIFIFKIEDYLFEDLLHSVYSQHEVCCNLSSVETLKVSLSAN